MKLKKKHFKKLKEIAVAVNQIVPGTGARLDKLIAEIESVQKPTDEAIYEMYRKEVEASFLKEGKAMVAASTDTGTEFKGGLRATVKQYQTLPGEGSSIGDFLDDALVLSNKDPKIGDVGYFNLGSPNAPIVYGRIRNFTGNNYQDMHGNLYCGFSKTPPELK